MSFNLSSLSLPASSRLSAPAADCSTAFPLNPEQEAAVAAMLTFLESSDDDFFLLEGPAGTGKTFCVKALINRLKGRLVFTAPTNKATKVLRESVEAPGYKPDCRTIYALLGLKLEANGEVKELAAPEDPIDLSRFAAVIVDEGSMVSLALRPHIQHAAKVQGVKFIFMGDRYQLPPVKEDKSWIWEIKATARLERVMRHDNQILDLATQLRTKMQSIAPSVSIASANDGDEGVWKFTQVPWITRMLEYAEAGHFSQPNRAKAIAWRNVTVDKLNDLIRRRIFGDGIPAWVEGDRLIMTAPAKDLEDEPIAATDDEGTVQDVKVCPHPIYGEFMCYAVSVCFDTNEVGTVWLLHEDSRRDFDLEKERRAAAARLDRKLWKTFWSFCDTFHQARYAYAITAHRSQGSTYQTAFVDYGDILRNPRRHEAFQCLYVAVTRPKKKLYLA